MHISVGSCESIKGVWGHAPLEKTGAICCILRCILAQFQFKNCLKISMFIATTKKKYATVTCYFMNTIALVFCKNKTM